MHLGDPDNIPSTSVFHYTVIDKSWPIESIGSKLRDYTRTFDSGIRARSTLVGRHQRKGYEEGFELW